MWWPAIGGVFVGIGGLIDPRVLGVGYELIHGILRGELLGPALLGLLIGKALVWSIALGSGTSGGVLAPLLLMGGALGAFSAQWMPLGDTGLWAMAGMAAVMAGTMRSPFTAIVFTLELTHDLNSLPVLLVCCVSAEIVTVLLLRRSILTEKVARRGHHLVREYSVDPLELARVGEVMDPDPPTVPPGMKVDELARAVTSPGSLYTKHQAFPVVDEGGRLCGIITRGDLLRALQERSIETLTVLEAGTKNVVVTTPDELLSSVVTQMLRHDIGRLVVVDPQDAGRPVGYIGRPNILMARMRRHEEEHVREPGWFARIPPLRPE